jgi:hypothetical protein
MLVVDANILIRGVLGVRVKVLLRDYADRAGFLAPERRLPRPENIYPKSQ